MVEAGVLGTELREVLGPVPDELCESPSPATSWISRARMATSFTKVWLSLKHRACSRAIRTHDTTSLILIKSKRSSHQKFVWIITSAEARESRFFWGVPWQDAEEYSGCVQEEQNKPTPLLNPASKERFDKKQILVTTHYQKVLETIHKEALCYCSPIHPLYFPFFF